MDGKIGEWLKAIGVIALICLVFKACDSNRSGGGCTPDDGVYTF